jgi:hypothetical protein
VPTASACSSSHANVVLTVNTFDSQAVACLERPWLLHKYYQPWRNVTLNGLALPRETVCRMREWTLPNAGQLKFDAVTYKVGREVV